MPIFGWGQDFNYEKVWKEVAKLESDRKTQDARTKVQSILDAAANESNDPQYVKGLLAWMNYSQVVEENSDSLLHARLLEETEKGSPLRRAIFKSLLAESYYQYYQNYQWQITQRTKVEEAPEDFQTWDTRTFIEKIQYYYLASLEETARLQNTSTEDYEAVMIREKNAAKYRPTLFDILAHRAIDFLKGSSTIIPLTPEDFVWTAEQGLAPAKTFVQTQFKSEDPSNAHYQIMRIYQQLIDFHLGKTAAVDALYDVDLQRLAFVHGQKSQPTQYLRALEQLLKEAPEQPVRGNIQIEIARWYKERGDSYKPSVSDDQWQRAYLTAYEIANQVSEKYSNTGAAQNARSLIAQLEQKDLQAKVEQVTLPSGPGRGLLTYRNVDKAYFRIIPYSKALEKEIEGIRYKEEKLANVLRKQLVIASWEVKLPATEDLYPHSAEFKIPKLESGQYYLLTSDNVNFKAKQGAVGYVPYTVSGMSSVYYRLEGDSPHHYFLTDRETGQPLAGVEALVYREQVTRDYWRKERGMPRLEQKLKTDENGKLEIPLKYDGEAIVIVFKKGKDTWQTPKEILYPGGRNMPSELANQRMVIFTDRKIYRPGQTIYFKGVLIENPVSGDPEILSGRPVNIALHDVNGQKVSELDLTTNDYGSIQGSFIAPASGLRGGMTLRTPYGNESIQVEEYKRPTFSVEVDPIEGSYELNELVNVKGKSVAFSGAFISSAQVKYRIVRQPWFPFYFWRGGFNTPEVEIGNGETSTDSEGKFSFDFQAIPGDRSTFGRNGKAVFTYKIYVDVVDISGETHSAESFVRIGENALDIRIDIPDQVYKDELLAFKVITHNLNGQFVETAGKIEVIALETPKQTFRARKWEIPDQYLMAEKDFRKAFPYDMYKNEQEIATWKEEKLLFDQRVLTKEDNVTLFPPGAINPQIPFPKELFQNAPQGKYKIRFTVADTSQMAEVYFTLTERETKTLPLPTVLKITKDKETYQPGEQAVYKFQTTEKKIWVLYQLSLRNTVLDEQWIQVKRGSEELRIPIVEDYRGNVTATFTYFYHNELKSEVQIINVPYSNKQLKLEWMTFRSPLQPGQREQWKLKISGPKADEVTAEMVATLYDASLDQFVTHSWNWWPYQTNYGRIRIETPGFGTSGSQTLAVDWNRYVGSYYQAYDRLNTYGWYFGGGGYAVRAVAGSSNRSLIQKKRFNLFGTTLEDKSANVAAPAAQMVGKGKERVVAGSGSDEVLDELEVTAPAEAAALTAPQADPIVPRRNLNETAFFFPLLETNEKGEILIDFTIPAALTTWKFMGLAHTKDLSIGQITGETKTQKDLMVVPNLPRFLREGDRTYMTAKIVNLSEDTLIGSADLKLLDIRSMESVSPLYGHSGAENAFTLAPKASEAVKWEVVIPKDQQAVAVQVLARAGDFTDGEENILPVLTNRMLVTETFPFALKGKGQSADYSWKKLKESEESTTLTQHQLTVEVTANPIWYAVQALPYLMEYPHECTEQIFSRFYANALATHIANSNPKIKQIFDQWKAEDASAFLSNLEKNQALKSALLAETPWVLDAKNEAEQKQRIGLLFDLNRMADEYARAKRQLKDRQDNQGGFAWFPGMRTSPYITTLVATGMGHLNKLGAVSESDPEMQKMLTSAVQYVDQEMTQTYNRIKKLDRSDNHLSYQAVQYLYMRSFHMDVPVRSRNQEAFNYYAGQAEKYWNEQGVYSQGMLSLFFHRTGKSLMADLVINALDQNAVRSKEKGMYWKANNGWFWWQAPIERHAMLIEAFGEIADDPESLSEMQYWLLQNKRTNDWKTTRATVAACNALLLTGGQQWLNESQEVSVTLGGEAIQSSDTEAGTGYYQEVFTGAEVTAEKAEIHLEKTGDAPAWGSMYWQYFEDLDKITFAETPLSIKKTINQEVMTDDGPILRAIDKADLKPGDKLIIRVEIRVDRAMSYVHMKDMRGAGLEPINVLSQYQYKNGLGYYESTGDAATNFFFEYLPEGTHVFEYPLRVNLPGNYSNGITTIQCMYAPEFTSHSEGVRVKIAP
ncbi:MAG: alpha-2-macroglobulin family protein [Bacteroidota bacterium]